MGVLEEDALVVHAGNVCLRTRKILQNLIVAAAAAAAASAAAAVGVACRDLSFRNDVVHYTTYNIF